MATEMWNRFIAHLPGTHILQTWQWAQVKAQYGWQPHYAVWSQPVENASRLEVHFTTARRPFPGDLPPEAIQAATLLLVRELRIPGIPLPICIAYAPKGPLMRWDDEQLRLQVLNELTAYTRNLGAIYLKIDPDVHLGTGVPGTPEAVSDPGGQSVVKTLTSLRWRFSMDQIQFKNTVLLDLTQEGETILAKMRQKTRYNIRLAARRGVEVRTGTEADLGSLYEMYVETSARDGFVIRDRAYYMNAWESFMRMESAPTPAVDPSQPLALPLIAEVSGEPIAAVLIYLFGRKAWFLYGMSRDLHREKMPNYLLQWEAIQQAKSLGCTIYDMWGAPDTFKKSDPLYGVYRFKQGFQGTIVRTIGAWDFAYQPVIYWLYTRILPQVLNMMRWRRKKHLRHEIEAI